MGLRSMRSSEDSKLGTAIRSRRTRLGLAQREIALRAQTTEAAISHIERGIRRPSAPLLARLAAALGCSADDLLAGVAGSPTESVYILRVVSCMKTLPPAVQEQIADYCDFLRGREKRRSRRR